VCFRSDGIRVRRILSVRQLGIPLHGRDGDLIWPMTWPKLAADVRTVTHRCRSAMMTKALRLMCVGKNRRGEPCGKWAVRGATVCRSHGAASPHVKARAAVRAEILDWGLNDATEDPGAILLRLVTQSAARAQRYAAELEDLVDAEGLAAAMVGDTVVATKYGTEKSGEYIRGLAQLEAQERDRCVNFATKAIAAGLAERQVRLAERQGEMLAAVVTAALAEVALPEEMANQVKMAIARQVRQIGVA